MQKEVVIPQDIEVKLENNILVVKGSKGELRREFKHSKIKAAVKDNKIIFSSEIERKKIKALIGTWQALVKNMISGASKGWQIKLKLVYTHFPVKLEIENGKLLIKNFLGERKPRVAKILLGTEVKIDKDIITVSGADKEKVGQTSSNIEQATKIKGYDRRTFQDGVYVLGKPQIEAKKIE